jgi:NAD(P)-dependent dehydrogenase (short-subunit alcohol dehydrogenase family)
MPGNDHENRRASMAAPGRAATPADIAPIVVSLASSDGGWLTGEAFYATGGVRRQEKGKSPRST